MSRDRSHSGFPSLLQLSGLTSTLPDTVLSHLFSQVRGGSDSTWGVCRGRGYRRDSASLGGRLLQIQQGQVIAPLPPSGAQEELVNNTELVQSYRQQISSVVNQANLQLFWNMYNRYGYEQSGFRTRWFTSRQCWDPPLGYPLYLRPSPTAAETLTLTGLGRCPMPRHSGE